MLPNCTRREFLHAAACSAAAAALGGSGQRLLAQVPGERPSRDASVEPLNPRMRVPLSFIIDDSTCLVNLNKFAVPQFAAAFGYQRYREQNWRAWPDEIPDDFVRKFGNWCGEHGIRGKYSVVPYPACVGRLDRELPGWTSQELKASIDLVRELMLPNWDIHPEMVTHTRVIDTKTGHPYPERSPRYMENWDWTTGRSVDELCDYLTYALKILKNIGLPCEGITTPGGFAGRVVPELSQATLQSVRDVFGTEIPHYFKFVESSGNRSTAPRVEYAAGLDGDDPRCVVSIIACTGDWTGGWDCSDRGHVDRFITPDLQGGRMVEVIERGEPAIMLCHWTGIYFNGEEVGFKVFQEAVKRLHTRFDHLQWMKLTDIARYWAARELTQSARQGSQFTFTAPFACPGFTVRLKGVDAMRPPRVTAADKPLELHRKRRPLELEAGTYLAENDALVLCFDLPPGKTVVEVNA